MKIVLFIALQLLLIGDSDQKSWAQEFGKLNRLIQTQASPAATAFREARDLIKDGEWGQAETRFSRFIADYPQDRDVAAAMYWLAFALKQQNKFPAADAALTVLIEKYPNSNWTNDARTLRVELAPRLKNNQVIEQGVSESNEEIKLAALQSLFEAKRERALAIAIDLLKPGSNASRMMKEGALTLLADSESKEAIPLLAELARTEPDVRLRKKAIEALGEIKDESALEPLKAIVMQATSANGDVSIARTALHALSQHEGGKARSLLLDIARSNAADELRVEAIHGLGEIENDPTVVDDLLKLFAAVQTSELQEAVIEALSEVELPRAQTALADLARTSTNAEVRRHAIEALGQRDGGIESLIQIYDAEKDLQVKERIVETLGDSEEKAALRKLMDIARRESSIQLRKRALSAIGRSEDPEAIKFLEDLLKKN
jgi:HEAT repeat protein